MPEYLTFLASMFFGSYSRSIVAYLAWWKYSKCCWLPHPSPNVPLLHILEWKGGWCTLLSRPTRWSLVLIFGFLSWSYFPIQITEGRAECTSNSIFSERWCHPPSTDPPAMLMHWCCWCADVLMCWCWCADADAAIQQIIFAVPKSIWGAELDLQWAVVSNTFDHLK